MPRKAMFLKNCDVCRGQVTLTVLGGYERYVCQNCAAVYYDSGQRDMRYQSKLDRSEARFAAAHSALLGSVRPAPVYDKWSSAIYCNGSLVQYQINPRRAWAYGVVKDYDPSQKLYQVEAGGKMLWLDESQLRSSNQPLPAPVAAPVSLASAARTSKRPVVRKAPQPVPALPRPVSVPVGHVLLWTYRCVGRNRSTPVCVSVPRNSGEIVTLDPNTGTDGFLYWNPYQRTWHLFELSGGALLGTSTVKRSLVRQVTSEIREVTSSEVLMQLQSSIATRAIATLVTHEQFFNTSFVEL